MCPAKSPSWSNNEKKQKMWSDSIKGGLWENCAL